jgi:hypothetical protein
MSLEITKRQEQPLAKIKNSAGKIFRVLLPGRTDKVSPGFWPGRETFLGTSSEGAEQKKWVL